MKYRIIGFICMIAGIGVLAGQLYNQSEHGDRMYVYPPGAIEEAAPGTIPSSDGQLIVDGCEVPHTTVPIEVSEAEAKRMREDTGFSSEGVSGGVIVKFNQTGPCPAAQE
ncbi:hypothetical protein [Paenibacillus kobensis]|uniref:hypothetical protein n=1 Tax=Paenibacillus kobensis TaxID=59841 RepID=UPI000FDAF678|nr:hypothetical protein [Paenibacillus kobensis]